MEALVEQLKKEENEAIKKQVEECIRNFYLVVPFPGTVDR